MCLASRDTEGPFIDTELRAAYRDPHIYLSCRWIEEAAKELGMVSKVEVDERYARIEAELEAQGRHLRELEELQAKAEEFEQAKHAVAESAFRDEHVPVDAIAAPVSKEFA